LEKHALPSPNHFNGRFICLAKRAAEKKEFVRSTTNRHARVHPRAMNLDATEREWGAHPFSDPETVGNAIDGTPVLFKTDYENGHCLTGRPETYEMKRMAIEFTHPGEFSHPPAQAGTIKNGDTQKAGAGDAR
jgi:hypothetical protein